MECSICGLSDKVVNLYEAISPKEIVKICENCSYKENLPILKKPTTTQLQKADTGHASDVLYPDGRPNRERAMRRLEISKKDNAFRELIDKNYGKDAKSTKAQPAAKRVDRADLVENFQWDILRARKSRKMTHKHVADAINETEAAVRLAENGVLPADDKLLNKLQSFFRINLKKGVNPLMQNPIENMPGVGVQIVEAPKENPQQRESLLKRMFNFGSRKKQKEEPVQEAPVEGKQVDWSKFDAEFEKEFPAPPRKQ